VSLQTISNVVNDKPGSISEKKRGQIKKLIEEYGYKPSKIAQSLRRGRTETIGLVVPDMIYHPFYPLIFDLIESELNDKGFNIILFNTREDIIREKKAVDELLRSKVDGIIFIRIIQKNAYLKNLPKNIPIIAFLRAFEYLNIPSILTDNKKIGILATEYLLEMGHKKILHIEGNMDLLAHRDRSKGYIETLIKHDIEIDNKFTVTCDFKQDDVSDSLKQTFKDLNSFTAVFAYNDIVAINSIKALINLGYKVPDDISVIGVDDLKIGNFIEPSLTTIRQPIENMCYKCVDLLIELINDKKKFRGNHKRTYFDPVLVERHSVKKME
jgi:DNA-binding LacI/PurR family transcriptional regulator